MGTFSIRGNSSNANVSKLLETLPSPACSHHQKCILNQVLWQEACSLPWCGHPKTKHLQGKVFEIFTAHMVIHGLGRYNPETVVIQWLNMIQESR